MRGQYHRNIHERTDAIFKSNDNKANKLDTYFKDIFPDYIQSTNNILTLLEDMEKSFKSSLPALTEEYNKLVSINASFKKQIIESAEKLFAKILEIDNNRFFYEYFEAINFLETRLELENKQIALFFKTLSKRIMHIKENPLLKTNVIATNSINDFKVDTTLLRKIHSLCDQDIFICAEVDFYRYIQTANFSTMKICKKTKVLRMIYYLSKVMPKDWYQIAAKSLNKTKDDCSSASVDYTDYWRAGFEKIDKRFIKRLG